MYLEAYNFIDAVYMTIITVSTVGFGEIHPLSETGRLFTSFIIVTSLSIFAYSISTITQYMFSGELRIYLKNYKVNQLLVKTKDHIIICGYGRNGSQATEELLSLGMTVVVVDQDENLTDTIPAHPHLIVMAGNAIQDETMVRARISKAKALITTLPNDADNLFVVLTARELNPRLQIISRASEDHSYAKLKRGGANNVIMPDKVGGIRMAKLIAQPDIVEFIESILLHKQDEVNLEEISCDVLSSGNIHKSIREFGIRDFSGANIIGLKTSDGVYIFNPSPDFKLSPEDKLFVLGTPRQIESLRKLITDENTSHTQPYNRFAEKDLKDQLL
jgi:voltage-gated potassium channel